MDHAALLRFFRRSSFTFLALEVGGESIVLRRTQAASAIVVTAPGVGYVEPPRGAVELPAPGDEVRQGEVLMRLKRFRSHVDVVAIADGEIERVEVETGTFCEFGTPLLRICALGRE